MGQSLYSKSYEVNKEVLSVDLVSDLKLLCKYLGKRKLKILKWDDDRIAVPIQVNVQLPPRGNHNGIDVRQKEDILFVFHKSKYPDVAPRVYSNRKSFPKDQLSHLYISKDGQPAPFCLVRGNYEEWFADKRITDLVVRVKNWLNDAASGDLVEDGGQFDPMRLEGYNGKIIYKHHELAKVVYDRRSFDGERNFTILLIVENEKPEPGKEAPSYEIKQILTKKAEVGREIAPLLKKIIKHQEGFFTKRMMFGALVWHDDNKVNSDFITDLPRDYNSLLEFGKKTGVDLTPAIDLLTALKLPGVDEIPLIVGVKRPKPLIGYNDDVEFFNYYLSVTKDDIKDNKIVNNIPVYFQSHNERLSVAKAREISDNREGIKSALVFGGGAVGSKAVMHLIRGGDIDITILDKDKIEPHNMVRHGLTGEVVGMNKASALESAAKQIFKSDTLKIIGIPDNGNYFFEKEELRKFLKNYYWVVDFTVSTAFENYIIRQELERENNVLKGFLTDEGRLGILLAEGKLRNPRVDDLRILCQAKYESEKFIVEWLKREHENSKNDSALVNVGVGCNSETTILSDDLISIHSAAFVRVIKDLTKVHNSREGGALYVTKVDDDGFGINTKHWQINPLTVLNDKNGGGWEIRIKNGLEEVLKAEMGKAMPHETGGVLIGLVNYKTKCIHVTDVIFAPPDSEANEVCFIRGIDGLKEQVDYHKEVSGQTFGYIGEWHSHPNGPLGLSGKDKRTMQEFKREYDKKGYSIPIFVMIVTPIGLLPFVY